MWPELLSHLAPHISDIDSEELTDAVRAFLMSVIKNALGRFEPAVSGTWARPTPQTDCKCQPCEDLAAFVLSPQTIGRIAVSNHLTTRRHLEEMVPQGQYKFSTDKSHRGRVQLVVEKVIDLSDRKSSKFSREVLARTIITSSLVRSCVGEIDAAASSKEIANTAADAQSPITEPEPEPKPRSKPMKPASLLQQNLPAMFCQLAGTKRKVECIDLSED